MVEKVEEVEEMDGKTAYSVAMGNLKSALSYPQVLSGAYPKKYFRYHSDGWGLALSGKIVFLNTPLGGEIKKVKNGKLTVEKQTALTNLFAEFCDIKMEIPEEEIPEVIKFTEDVKTKMSATHTSH
jgi:hypothetical protein